MGERLRSNVIEGLIRGNGLGPFAYGGTEFLRRIFVTVRDRNWQEITPGQFDCRVGDGGRTIRVGARHTSELVDFEWRGELELGREGRSLTFALEGKALRTMDVCRLGLVILHPVATLAGARVKTHGSDGERRYELPDHVSPQPIVNGAPAALTEPFSQIVIEHSSLGRLEMRFLGELFELEDQRNWGDSSFKTYCTPLRLGYPRTIPKGFRIAHSVQVSFEPSPNASQPLATPDPRPRIGRVPPMGTETAEEPSWALGWDHIRVDGAEATTDYMERLLSRIPRDVKLEIVISTDRIGDLTDAIEDWVHANAARIATLILTDHRRPLPAAADVSRLRKALDAGPARPLPLLVSPGGYFVEFNRNQRLELQVDGIAFPLTSTVHSDDSATILENRCAVSDMVKTLRYLTGKSHIAISPLALNLPSRENGHFPSALIAPWLLAVLGFAAQADVTSITLAADVLEGLGPSSLIRSRNCGRAAGGVDNL